MEKLVGQYKNLLLDFDKIGADSFFKDLIEKNDQEALINCIQQALIEIGDEWENDQLALSQLYIGGTITEELIDKYFPTENTEIKEIKIGIVTLGDFHILGKKILKSILKTSNIQILDLGHGISPAQIVEKLRMQPVKLLLVSVLMYPTALEVKKLIELIKSEGFDTKVMVGGAPFNFDTNLWMKVNADATGTGPKDAIRYIKELKLA